MPDTNKRWALSPETDLPPESELDPEILPLIKLIRAQPDLSTSSYSCCGHGTEPASLTIAVKDGRALKRLVIALTATERYLFDNDHYSDEFDDWATLIMGFNPIYGGCFNEDPDTGMFLWEVLLHININEDPAEELFTYVSVLSKFL